MNALTVKISPELERQIASACARERIGKSELVRRAIAVYVTCRSCSAVGFVSALDRAGDLVGCFEGGPVDLANKRQHMKTFGKV